MQRTDAEIFSCTPADEWHNPRGQFRTLHAVNAVRLRCIREQVTLAGRKAIDLGCGGGLLASAMARHGARVTGVDVTETVLQAAQQRALDQELPIRFECGSVEQYAQQHPHEFDVVCCMELLEHVTDPQALVQDCARLAAPGGRLFFSTLNRSPLSFCLAILGAEYALGLLPMGTHQYKLFLRPSELAGMARNSGLEVQEVYALGYLPLLEYSFLGGNPRINYLLCAQRPMPA